MKPGHIVGGNAEELGHLAPLVRQFHCTGFSVLSYHYRGYGLRTGGPASAKAYRDLPAVYRYAVEESGVQPDQLDLVLIDRASKRLHAHGVPGRRAG
jgi:hypothetical protein